MLLDTYACKEVHLSQSQDRNNALNLLHIYVMAASCFIICSGRACISLLNSGQLSISHLPYVNVISSLYIL
nr:MAG TPA: hypothetical protein [Caudoviricetes sp.]